MNTLILQYIIFVASNFDRKQNETIRTNRSWQKIEALENQTKQKTIHYLFKIMRIKTHSDHIFIIQNNYYYLWFDAFEMEGETENIVKTLEHFCLVGILCANNDIVDFLDCHFVRFALTLFFYEMENLTNKKIAYNYTLSF